MRPNENKVSDGHQERARLGVKTFDHAKRELAAGGRSLHCMVRSLYVAVSG